MKTRTFLPAITFVTVLAACVTAMGKQDLDCSNAAECRVQVSVKCAASCAIDVDHERVIGKRNGQIVWELQNQSGQTYRFDRTKGIVFPTDSRTNFACHVEADGARFSCSNRGDRGEYKYTVNLAGSPAVGPLDPWVVNN